MAQSPARRAAPQRGCVWLLSLCAALVGVVLLRYTQAPALGDSRHDAPEVYMQSVPVAPAPSAPDGPARLASSTFQLRHGTPPPWNTHADGDHWRMGTRFATSEPRASLVARCVWAPVHVLVVRPILWIAHLVDVLVARLMAIVYVVLAPVRTLCMAVYIGAIAWPWQALEAMAPILYQLYVLGGVAVLLGLGLGALGAVLLRGEHGLYVMRARRRGA